LNNLIERDHRSIKLRPLPGPAEEDGPPMLRGFVLPARDWQIEDTWYVAGLKGTGSHHVTLRETLVPAAIPSIP
jgi:hypothetical protein